MVTSKETSSRTLSHGPEKYTLILSLKKMKEKGQFTEVIQDCLKALSIYPGDVSIRYILAESYFEMGFLAQAEEELNKIASDMDKLVLIYRLQAEIYLRQERIEEAIGALRLYLSHNPNDRAALDLFAKIKPGEEKLMEENIKSTDISQINERQGNLFADFATPTLAEIYYEQGQIHEAINTYEKILLENPDDKVFLKRLEELKALIPEETVTSGVGGETERGRKEKMISILEKWLQKIKETQYGQ
jgi:tetratricopeptide (TPR) repeat protein